jgi:uncharacterized protein YbjT (DUF2867 family)
MLLLTGATGYIGRHLVARLIAQGEHPRCLVRNIGRARELLGEQVELVQGATTRPETLAAALSDVDTVVHAAFLTADRKQSSENHYWETNVHGAANLVEAAQKAGVQRIIEISGLGTKPDKPGSYMQGRYLAERRLIDSRLDWTIIRPSVLFGDNAPFIKGLTDLIRTSPVVPLIGGGKMRFQPIYVEDVVSVIVKILADPAQTNGKIYTIGGPDYWTFTQIIDALLHATKKRRLKVYAPLPFVGMGAAALEIALPKPPLTRAAMALFSFDNITDLESVERDFGFQPLSFRDYLERHNI